MSPWYNGDEVVAVTSRLHATEEQEAIIEAVRKRTPRLQVAALAGTGKTSTLVLVSERALPAGGRGQYVAYNRSIANDAKCRMPSTVQAGTSHALAYRAMHPDSRQLVNSIYSAQAPGVRPPRGVEEWLGGHGFRGYGQAERLARTLVGDVIVRFCFSADDEIGAEHARSVSDAVSMGIPLLKSEDKDALLDSLIGAARQLWGGLASFKRSPETRITHDVYLKLWQLSRPRIPADVIMLDEAQDANPALLDVLLRQDHAQLILVGDENQQLYAWRLAVDAMAQTRESGFPTLPLTQTWRFGQSLAEVTNVLLRFISEAKCRGEGEPLQIHSGAAFETAINLKTPAGTVPARLCRTNATLAVGAFEAAMRGKRVHVVRDAKAVCDLLEGLHRLRQGQPVSYPPELALFPSWAALEELTEHGDVEAHGYVPLMRIVTDHAADLPQKVDALRRSLVEDERSADVIVSTVHSAKGREWDYVALSDDLWAPFLGKEGPDADAGQVAYVGVTRAKRWVTGIDADALTRAGAPPAVLRLLEPGGTDRPVQVRAETGKVAAPGTADTERIQRGDAAPPDTASLNTARGALRIAVLLALRLRLAQLAPYGLRRDGRPRANRPGPGRPALPSAERQQRRAASKAAWRASNRERLREYDRERRAQQRQAGVETKPAGYP